MAEPAKTETLKYMIGWMDRVAVITVRTVLATVLVMIRHFVLWLSYSLSRSRYNRISKKLRKKNEQVLQKVQ
jgi:Na+/melibiose symporter-like transporter